jgi:tetratricopeptide (TPR) repeat protein
MPRWLSEGISVHEEQQAKSGWGQRFKPRHAGRLMKGQFTPIERMSEAFRSGNGAELDFAYFQSGLIVDWLVKKRGANALRGLLEDLGKGSDVNEAISKRYGPISQLNSEFSKYAVDWASRMAGSLRWKAALQGDASSPKDLSEKSAEDLYEDLIREGERAFRAKDYETARSRFETVLNAAPNVPDSEGALFWLAKTYRALGLDAQEIAVLRRALESIADFPGAHERLVELYAKLGEWEHLIEIAGQQIGVSPMSIGVIEGLAMAHERQGQNGLAVAEFKRVLALDPDRAPRWHSKIGVLLEESAPTDARSHLLDALEVNPRDRAALEALCRIVSKYPNVVEAAKPLQPDESKRQASPSSDQGGAVK